MEEAPLLDPIKRACAIIGVGETKFRELVAAGEIETVLSGGRRLAVRASLVAYVERLRAVERQKVGSKSCGQPAPAEAA